MTEISEAEVRVLLREKIEAAGTQLDFAEKNDLSRGYVNEVLNGRRFPGDRLCELLGIRVETRRIYHLDDEQERAA